MDIENNKNEDDEQKEKQEHYQLLKLLEKDEQARKIALEAGNHASRDALKQGIYTSQQIAEIAKQEMIKVLKDFKPSNVTTEKGIDNALKIRDMFIEEEN